MLSAGTLAARGVIRSRSRSHSRSPRRFQGSAGRCAHCHRYRRGAYEYQCRRCCTSVPNFYCRQCWHGYHHEYVQQHYWWHQSTDDESTLHLSAARTLPFMYRSRLGWWHRTDVAQTLDPNGADASAGTDRFALSHPMVSIQHTSIRRMHMLLALGPGKIISRTQDIIEHENAAVSTEAGSDMGSPRSLGDNQHVNPGTKVRASTNYSHHGTSLPSDRAAMSVVASSTLCETGNYAGLGSEYASHQGTPALPFVPCARVQPYQT
jgi:hypothetical protein